MKNRILSAFQLMLNATLQTFKVQGDLTTMSRDAFKPDFFQNPGFGSNPGSGMNYSGNSSFLRTLYSTRPIVTIVVVRKYIQISA